MVDMFQSLQERLAAVGVAPSLRVMGLTGIDPRGYNFRGRESAKAQDLAVLAAMLETRSQRSGCRELDISRAGTLLNGRPENLAARCRLLRALLPSTTELDKLEREAAYEACFVATQPLPMKKIHVVGGGVQGVSMPSLEWWESMAQLEGLAYVGSSPDVPDFVDLGALISGLNRGVAFQHLQRLHKRNIKRWTLASWKGLLDAVARAPCAPQLTALAIDGYRLWPGSMVHMSALLAQDAFPVLHRYRC